MMLFGLILMMCLFSITTPVKSNSSAVLMSKVKTQWHYKCVNPNCNWGAWCPCNQGKCLTWPYRCDYCGSGITWTSHICIID